MPAAVAVLAGDCAAMLDFWAVAVGEEVGSVSRC